MTWEPYGDYAKRCGNHSVCWVMVRGVQIYELWRIGSSECLARGTREQVWGAYEQINQSQLPVIEEVNSEY